MTNKPNGTLYLGQTSNLDVRVWEHKNGFGAKFTRKYNLHKLVWYEQFDDHNDAKDTEHRMKRWRREWKIKCIEDLNPNWNDLAAEF